MRITSKELYKKLGIQDTFESLVVDHPKMGNSPEICIIIQGVVRGHNNVEVITNRDVSVDAHPSSKKTIRVEF